MNRNNGGHLQGVYLSLLVFLLFVGGCGGGTGGSGLNTYEGRIVSTEATPLPDVTITLLSSGESAVTDAQGNFSLQSNVSGKSVEFKLESPLFQNSFTLDNLPEDSSRTVLTITVDTVRDTIDIQQFNLKAYMVGRCDFYFENSDTIRQANSVPDGTFCSLNIEVLGDGRRVENIPIALQYSSCEEGAAWNDLALTITGKGRSSGFAELNFPFRDSEVFCRYRVVAPYRLSNHREQYYPIDTFTEQQTILEKSMNQ